MSFNRRSTHHFWHTVRSLKTWQLTIILLFMIFTSATLLRLNNLGMVERREAVIKADKAGDMEKVEQSLQELRKYVNSHMNAGLGDGVYLEQSYTQARNEALERASDTTNPNSEAYKQASVECRSRFQGGVESYRNDYVQCVIDRVGTMTQAQDPTAGVNLPKADMYRHNFVSPVWSPDAAGLTVLLSLLIASAIAFKVALWVITKTVLRKHYRQANS